MYVVGFLCINLGFLTDYPVESYLLGIQWGISQNKGFQKMLKEIENLIRVRKLIRKKVKYGLPKSKATPSTQTLEYAEKSNEAWFNSLKGKSAYEITDSIFVESW